MKKFILLLLLIILVIGISIFAFRKFSERYSRQHFPDIIDNEYIYLDDGKTTDITLTFSNDGRAFGFGGVNRYFAGYKLENNNLVLSPIGSTMMAGPVDSMDMERKYLDLLNNVNKIKICKDKITLITNNNKKLNFVKSDKKSSDFINDDETNNSSDVIGPNIKDK